MHGELVKQTTLPEWASVIAVAQWLGVSKDTVYLLIQGRLKTAAQRMGRIIRIHTPTARRLLGIASTGETEKPGNGEDGNLLEDRVSGKRSTTPGEPGIHTRERGEIMPEKVGGSPPSRTRYRATDRVAHLLQRENTHPT